MDAVAPVPQAIVSAAAALPDAHAQGVLIEDLDKFGVDLSGKSGVIFKFRSPGLEVEVLDIVHKGDGMGIADGETGHENSRSPTTTGLLMKPRHAPRPG